MKKLYARMLKAHCPIDLETMETTVPFIQHDTVPHVMADEGVRQIFFFVDRDPEARGNIFSITIYDSEEHLQAAMKDASSEFRFKSLDVLGCTAVDARTFDVVAGDVNPDAPEVDFKELIPPMKARA